MKLALIESVGRHNIETLSRILKNLNKYDIQKIEVKSAHLLSWPEFYCLYWEEALRQTSNDQSWQHDHESLLRDLHIKKILKAIKEDLQIPLFNLREYRFKPEMYIHIRRYCRQHKIDLDE